MIRSSLFALLIVLPQDPPTTPVARGDLALAVSGEATFEAADPFEVRLRPESYAGEWIVVAGAADGSPVRKGDGILRLDPAPLRRQLEAAENDLRAAKAGLRKTEEDLRAGEKADALALQMQKETLKQAEFNLQWWKEVEGRHMLKNHELGIKNWEDSVADQEEELDQLKKMYKSEELTSATAEIVVKRAVRQLERTKIQAEMAKETAKRTVEVDHPAAELRYVQALEQARHQLAQLESAQAHGRVLRETELVRARANVAQLEEQVAELKKDAELTEIRSPIDGTVLHGHFAQGAWQARDPKALRPGERVQPQQALMTVFAPGRLSVKLDVPESKIFWIRAGMAAEVTPAAVPESRATGKCRSISPVGMNKGAGQVHELVIEVGEADARILPGMKASVQIAIEQLSGVLLVPATAVSNGKVWVRKDGKDEERAVSVGRSNGKWTEVKSGLTEGEEVLTQAKP